MPLPYRRYGWTPDHPDHRDHRFKLDRPDPTLPIAVDLRPGFPMVYDQLDIGSCTANAVAAAIEFGERKQTGRSEQPSRLFIYYNTRSLENTTESDAGAMIRDAVKSVNLVGACVESDWPYRPNDFAVKPPQHAYDDAIEKALEYKRLDNENLNELKGCLAQGLPFVFGFTVYDSFESDAVTKTGIVPMPGLSESSLGGHAVVAVGYDDNLDHPELGGRFIVRNSWGPLWGDAGAFHMPYAYLTNPDLAADFWCIQKVT